MEVPHWSTRTLHCFAPFVEQGERSTLLCYKQIVSLNWNVRILARYVLRWADCGFSLPAWRMYVNETFIKCVDVSEGAEAPDT